MGVSAAQLAEAASTFTTVARELSGQAAAFAAGTADNGAAALVARRSGSAMLGQLSVLDEIAAPFSEIAAIRDGIRGVVETLLVRSGELSGGTVASVADDFSDGARAARQAARALDMEAYFARSREGIKPGKDAARAITVRTDDLVVPSAEVEARELAELHRIAATRTPEGTVKALITGKVGNGIAWDEYARLYEVEFGPERAARLRDLLNTAIERTIEASEQLKHAMPRQRPFVVDPTLSTVLTRPTTLSFPSGHTARAEAAGTIFIHEWTERALEFRHLADEVGPARMYGGVHFRSDIDAGRTLGRRIAEQVLEEAGELALATA